MTKDYLANVSKGNNQILPFVPYDKSWIIRMSVLDMLYGFGETMIDFLTESQPVNFSTDLQALLRVNKQWKNGEPLEVGESATLYRFLRFASWVRNEDREFIKSGTLLNREITDNPEIISWGIDDLLKLDNGTSQWASASVLTKSNKISPNDYKSIPYKLKLTASAVISWDVAVHQGHGFWKARKDWTIGAQAISYAHWLRNGKNNIRFTARQPEDYCFARAFGLVTSEFALANWPSLISHESNRIAEMEKPYTELLESKDHRVIQAIAMRYDLGKNAFAHPESVEKSWPQFWDFLEFQKEAVKRNHD